jgi:hypothetical protein
VGGIRTQRCLSLNLKSLRHWGSVNRGLVVGNDRGWRFRRQRYRALLDAMSALIWRVTGSSQGWEDMFIMTAGGRERM